MIENNYRVRIVEERNLPNMVGGIGMVDLHLEHTNEAGHSVNLRIRARVKKTAGTRSKAEFDAVIVVSRGFFHEKHPVGAFRLRRGDHPFLLRHQLHSGKVFATI